MRSFELGLRTIFKNTEIQVIGEASDQEELLSQIKSFKPDVVLIDYTSENFSIDVIPKAIAICDTIRFVAITPQQTDQHW